jgi:uncharacterized protein
MGKTFVGRTEELQLLAADVDHIRKTGEGRLVWMRGRRRIGKSRLAQELIEAVELPYVFFQAPRRGGFDALERFRLALEESELPAAELVRGGARFDSWPAALRLACQGATAERPVAIVIDELPYLVEFDPGIAADLQEAWDRHLQHAPMMLICIGSDMRMMQALTQYPAELYGRPTREMVVKPFTPREIAAMSGPGAADAFDRYLVVGGFPVLARSWPARASLRCYLAGALTDTSPLVVDGMRILDAELPAQLHARDVLEAIGHGERTFTAIGRRSGVTNSAGLADALRIVVEKGIVESSLPYAAPPGRKNRRYAIADPYLRFWLRFIGPALEEIDRGRSDLLLGRIERDWTTYRGTAIEPIVRRSVERLLGDKRFGAARYVGSYWTRTNVPEVDLVGADEPEPASVSFVGSIKWRENTPFSRRDTQRLLEHRDHVPGAGEARLVGVSRSGFATEAALDVALSAEDLLHAWPEL